MNTDTHQDLTQASSDTSESSANGAPGSPLSPSLLHFLRHTEARAESMATKRVKSENTLATIVATAMEIAVGGGLTSISLGDIARRLNISKSGVFARVGSLEALQYLVLAQYDRTFAENMFLPAMKEARGLPRLTSIMTSWIEHAAGRSAVSGALHMAAAYDAQLDGTPLRQRLLESVTGWRDTLARTVRQCVEEGHFRADTDANQVAFELSCLVTGVLHDSRLMVDPETRERAMSAFRRVCDLYARAGTPS